MKVTLNIKRQKLGESTPYWQSFALECAADATVVTLLKQMKAQAAAGSLTDAQGNLTGAVVWEASCGEGKCGACAMVINGVPQLACKALIGELGASITLEPLSKFPTVVDLAVDRSQAFDALKELERWLEPGATEKVKDFQLRYDASMCLNCGCCLEACPNFSAGGDFLGAMGALAAFRKLDANSQNRAAFKRAKKAYKKLFYSGCSKSLACEKICPANLPQQKIMTKANRAALFKR